jgi:hypothetical protein
MAYLDGLDTPDRLDHCKCNDSGQTPASITTRLIVTPDVVACTIIPPTRQTPHAAHPGAYWISTWPKHMRTTHAALALSRSASTARHGLWRPPGQNVSIKPCRCLKRRDNSRLLLTTPPALTEPADPN